MDCGRKGWREEKGGGGVGEGEESYHFQGKLIQNTTHQRQLFSLARQSIAARFSLDAHRTLTCYYTTCRDNSLTILT